MKKNRIISTVNRNERQEAKAPIPHHFPAATRVRINFKELMSVEEMKRIRHIDDEQE